MVVNIRHVSHKNFLPVIFCNQDRNRRKYASSPPSGLKIHRARLLEVERYVLSGAIPQLFAKV